MALVVAALVSLLSVGVTGASATATVISSGATAISAGEAHDCAVLGDGEARCWGRNLTGQLGDGTTTNSATPVSPLGLSDVATIRAGDRYTCALIDDGTVDCWGSNFWGRLGDGTGEDSATPVQVTKLSNATDMGAAEGHGCAVVSGGTARCWGENISEQLGNSGPSLGSFEPVDVSTLTDATAISTGLLHTCALLSDGTAQCWGGNNGGQLGIGTTTWETATPTDVVGLSGATAISVRRYHSCALLGSGSVRCWGYNLRGELGDGTTTRRYAPVAVSGLTDATAVSAGWDHTCAVLGDGTAKCWGDNGLGQLGNRTSSSYSSTPVTVYGLKGVVAISAGYKHTCAVLTGGAVECWGLNYGARDVPSAPSSSPASRAPRASATPPRARITSHPPKETADQRAIFTFTGAPGGTYECSVDAGPWRRCRSGQDFGPLLPGDHGFSVRQTVKGLTGPADSYTWTIALPRACVLRVARARVLVHAQKQRVRLVIRYKTYRPAEVTVSYELVGGRGNLALGQATSRFQTAGLFRLTKPLGPTEMGKVRSARYFKLRFRIPGTPGSCARFYTKRLTIPKRIGGQKVWFQSDSIFGIGGGI